LGREGLGRRGSRLKGTINQSPWTVGRGEEKAWRRKKMTGGEVDFAILMA